MKTTEMITVIGTHEVKDAKAWKVGFDADEVNRAKAGVKLNGVYASLENPNHITLSMDFPSVEAFESMMSSPELQKAMADAGVIGKPEFKVLTNI